MLSSSPVRLQTRFRVLHQTHRNSDCFSRCDISLLRLLLIPKTLVSFLRHFCYNSTVPYNRRLSLHLNHVVAHMKRPRV